MPKKTQVALDRVKNLIEVREEGKDPQTLDFSKYISTDCTHRNSCTCKDTLDSFFNGVIMKHRGQRSQLIREDDLVTIIARD